MDATGVSDLAHAYRQLARQFQLPQPRKTFGLTPRELEIVAAVLAGEGNRGIATKLRISDQTVKNHLTAIFDKVGVSSRLELGLFAKHLEAVEDLSRIVRRANRAGF